MKKSTDGRTMDSQVRDDEETERTEEREENKNKPVLQAQLGMPVASELGYGYVQAF